MAQSPADVAASCSPGSRSGGAITRRPSGYQQVHSNLQAAIRIFMTPGK